MSRIKIQAKDSFHLSGVGMVNAGKQAIVSKKVAEELEAAGHADIIGPAKDDEVIEDDAPAKNTSKKNKGGAPENKALKPDENKDKENKSPAEGGNPPGSPGSSTGAATGGSISK